MAGSSYYDRLIESRSEYGQSPEERLNSCRQITSLVDDIFSWLPGISGQPSIDLVFNINESVDITDRILEGLVPVRKKIQLVYTQMFNITRIDRYQIQIDQSIQRPNVWLTPLVAKYSIDYAGEFGELVSATMQSSIAEIGEDLRESSVLLPMTPYDQKVLLAEVAGLLSH